MILKITCQECGLEFESRRSFHSHVKCHSMTIGDYYVKYSPKFDLYTKDPIPFKDYETYIKTDFRNKKNMSKYLDILDAKKRKEYCESTFIKHMQEERSLKYAPNYLYFLTHPRLPRIKFFEKQSLDNLFNKFNLENVFSNTLKDCPDFSDIPNDLCIFQDTREQAPLKFKGIKTEIVKLDFADYTLSGDYYSYIYVDRKAENDFKGTMSKGFERFCNELEKARLFGAYIYIIIESDFKKIYLNNNLKYNKKINLSYTWKNMREIISNYSDVCQFVFTGSRENSEKIIPFLLLNGSDLKNIDMQLYLEEYKCLG